MDDNDFQRPENKECSKRMALENVKGCGKEKSLCLMCFAELDLVMKSLVNKSLAKCCSTGDVSPSRWP